MMPPPLKVLMVNMSLVAFLILFMRQPHNFGATATVKHLAKQYLLNSSYVEGLL